METLIQNQNRVAAFSVFNEEVGMVLTKGQLSEFSLKNNAYILSLLMEKHPKFPKNSISKDRRESGIFFTTTNYQINWHGKYQTYYPRNKVVDPACGAGDLL